MSYQWVEVVFDPTGDFKPDARFPAVQFNSGLEQLIWSENMIVKQNKRYYKVITVRKPNTNDRYNTHIQVLKECEYEPLGR